MPRVSGWFSLISLFECIAFHFLSPRRPRPMVFKCSAPGCRSGYDKITTKGITFHKFPLGNKEILRKWTHCLPRANLVPNQNSSLCSLHFTENDFITTSKDHRRNKGSPKTLRRRRLLPNAVPSKFPNCPAFLSKSVSASRMASSSARFEKEAMRMEKKIDDFLSADYVDSMTCLKKKLSNSTLPTGFTEVRSDNCFSFD